MLVRAPARRHRRRAASREPDGASGCAGSAAGSRSSPPTSTRSTRSCTPPTACSAFAGSLVAISVPALGFGLALLAATSMYLDLNAPPLPAPQAVLPPRVAERRLARRPGRDAPARLVICAHLDAARTGAVFTRRARPALGRARAALAVPARPVPDPVLVAGGPAPAARAADGGTRLRARSQCSSSSPPWSLLVGDLRPGRDPALRCRPRRQRQRLRRRDRDLARRRARGRAARRTSTSGSCSTAPASACRRACGRSCARTASGSSKRTTFFLALDSVGAATSAFETSARLGGQLRHGPPPDRALRGDRRPPTPRASALRRRRLRQRPRRRRRCRRGSRACARSGSPASTPTATVPNRHLPTDTPEAIDLRRARPRPRLRARADPPPRRRPRPRARGAVIEVRR